MDDWVTADDFIPADVIRWTEGIFDRRRKGKALRIGERLVTAEVLSRGPDNWVQLLVRGVEITRSDYAGKTIPLLKAGETVKRGLTTNLRGKPVRLLWSDESAREAVTQKRDASRYLGTHIEDLPNRP